MTARYDEWVAARAPALGAFAAALVDDPTRAEAAVARALRRVAGGWDRVSRDDPDLVARRYVVNGCSSPARAALVLRLVEDRSDAEIAEVLGCSRLAARRHLDRGLTSAEPSAVAVRDPVDTRFGTATTQLLVRTLPTVGEPRRRGPRAPWLAALVVLLMFGGVAYGAHEVRTQAATIHYRSLPVPASWRYESYAGVQVAVPATWGWGAAPVHAIAFDTPGHLGSCGTNAGTTYPSDNPATATDVGFVGRPVKVTELCVPWGSDGTLPTADAVWFDSPLPVGVKSLPGTVAETRAVGDQRVTAFAASPALRRQILGSAQVVAVDGNGCPTQAVAAPTGGRSGLRPDMLAVCVYSQDTGATRLLYSTSLGASAAQDYAAQVARVTRSGSGCRTPNGRWVSLGLVGPHGVRWDVANLDCGRIQLAGGQGAALTSATVRSWAVRGVTAYVGAPSGEPLLQPYFRAPTD